jgi:hypothetical protein
VSGDRTLDSLGVRECYLTSNIGSPCPVQPYHPSVLRLPHGEPVIGTHMMPWRLLGEPDALDAADGFAVVGSVDANSIEVIATRAGGLFVRIPETERPGFVDRAVSALNLVLCEFALAGVESEPVSAHDLARGEIGEGRAAILSGVIGDHSPFDRTIGPWMAMADGRWGSRGPGAIYLALPVGLNRAKSLARVSKLLPRLIVGAYYNDVRRHAAENLIGCWIVVEQFLDRLWEEHLASITERARLERLRDPRTYSAGVRSEMLRTVGVLTPELHAKIEAARTARNRLAHRADLSSVDGNVGMEAMIALVEHYLGEPIELGRELWRGNRDAAEREVWLSRRE